MRNKKLDTMGTERWICRNFYTCHTLLQFPLGNNPDLLGNHRSFSGPRPGRGSPHIPATELGTWLQSGQSLWSLLLAPVIGPGMDTRPKSVQWKAFAGILFLGGRGLGASGVSEPPHGEHAPEWSHPSGDEVWKAKPDFQWHPLNTGSNSVWAWVHPWPPREPTHYLCA